MLFTSVWTRGNFSPARKVRSTTAPVSRFLTFVRTNAPPFPGLTCWNSTMRHTPPSSSMCMPFLNWLVEIVSATARQSSQRGRARLAARLDFHVTQVKTRGCRRPGRMTEAMRRTRPWALYVVLLLSFVALPVTASAESAAVPSPAVVKVAVNKKLKKSILVDSRGITLYLFVIDRQGKPTCTNDPTYHCSKVWLP